jgi:hypothetical protein
MALNQSAIVLAVRTFNNFEVSMTAMTDNRIAMGRAMCAILPLEINFADYTVVAKAWKAEYKGSTDNANDQAWNRAIGFMNGYLTSIQSELFVIPKSESADAKVKAAKRAAHQAKINAAVQSAKPADLQKRALAGDKIAAEAISFLGRQAREVQDAKYALLKKTVREELKDAPIEVWQDIAKMLKISAK